MKTFHVVPEFLLVTLVFFSRPLGAATAAPDAPVNLAQAFSAALSRSETILDQDEQIVQAGEKYRQAVGAALPSISALGSYTVQDNPATNATNISPNTQPLVKLTLSQPLFRGLREFRALSQMGSLEKAQGEQKRQAMLLLFYDVSQSFFTVLSLEKDQENVANQISLYEKRIKELKDRVRIGRSRNTEVLTVESSVGSLRASLEQIRGQIAASRELFSFITGLSPTTKLTEQTPIPKSVDALDAHLRGLETRPDIKAAEYRLDAARSNVDVQWGAHFPSIDFTANYYPYRFGVAKDVKWDVGVAVTLPIFNGGILTSKVREASSQAMQSELQLSRAKRQATQEIRTFHQNVQADLRALEELENTRDVSEKNFQDQTKEYRLGLVNNLDVIQALTSFQESQRSLDRARFIAKLDVEKLRAAVGQSSAAPLSSTTAPAK